MEVVERVSGAFSWEGARPDRLRRGVRKVLRGCGVSRTDWIERGLDVHHIVAAGLEGAAPGRRVLVRWSVSVHNIVNAAVIPRSFHQGQGLHRQAFLDVVNRRLASADVLAEALQLRAGFSSGRLIIVQTIQKIGSELVLRSGDPLAIRVQGALQEEAMQAARPATNGSEPRVPAIAERVIRSSQERCYASAGGSDRDDEAVRGPRGSGFCMAPACG